MAVRTPAIGIFSLGVPMLKLERILLASHGTAGARAADRAALSLCAPHGTLFHLVVVPDLWRGMMGDDWLNNASTRDAYAAHVESELEREIALHRRALEAEVARSGLQYQPKVTLGEPAECLLGFARTVAPDLVVIGAPRPRGRPGLRSRMKLETLAAGLAAPLLIVPHPA